MSAIDQVDQATVISKQLECGDFWLLDGRSQQRKTQWLVTDTPVDLREWR